MAKPIVFAALIAALLAVASATTYTTVVTTTSVDGENRGESCMQEYQQQQRMSHCRMWMQGMMEGGRYVSNPARRGAEGEHLQQCCQQLEQISSPCRCEALKMMWMEQRPMGEQMQEMKGMVESLPSMCPGMEFPRQCRMESMLY